MTKIRPLGSRVLVQYKKPEDTVTTTGGLLLSTASASINHFDGVVVEVGNLTTPNSASLKPGDKIAYLKYGYEDMGNDLHLVEEQSLLAVYE